MVHDGVMRRSDATKGAPDSEGTVIESGMSGAVWRDMAEFDAF